jgi:hypothetical protein
MTPLIARVAYPASHDVEGYPQAVSSEGIRARVVTQADNIVSNDSPAGSGRDHALQRSFSGSTLDSMRSADHGTLEALSGSMQHFSEGFGDGPWTIYSGLPEARARPVRQLRMEEDLAVHEVSQFPEAALMEPVVGPGADAGITVLQMVCYA